MRSRTAAPPRACAVHRTVLVSMFVLVTVFGQFRFDSRASSARCSRMCRASKGELRPHCGVEVGKVKDLTLHKDGTVTVDFAIDKIDAHRRHQGRGALRKPHRRPLSSLEDGPARCGNCNRTDDPAGRTSPARRRRSHRWLPALVFRALDPDQVNALSRRTAERVPGPGRHHLVGAGPDLCTDHDAGGRDRLIGQVITNLDTVLAPSPPVTISLRRFWNKLSQLVRRTGERNYPILPPGPRTSTPRRDPLRPFDGRPPSRSRTPWLRRPVAGQVMADHDFRRRLVRTLPDAYQVLARKRPLRRLLRLLPLATRFSTGQRQRRPARVRQTRPSRFGRCTPK